MGFGSDALFDGRRLRALTVVDDSTHQALAIDVAQGSKGEQAVEAMTRISTLRGSPRAIRVDNGPEFIAKALRDWIVAVGTKTAYIMPGSPWENSYCESFNSKLRDELLNGEIFYTMKEARIVIESWRRHYNTVRPHSSLNYKPPAPEVLQWPAAQPGPATPATPALKPRPMMH